MKEVKEKTQETQNLSRRDALKTLAAATGATALSTLPSQWEQPMVEIGALPAFAQASPGGPAPVTYPFTSRVELGGPGSGNIPTEDQGWVVINVNNGAPEPVPTPAILGNVEGITSQQTTAVLPPILRNARRFLLSPPSWTSVTSVTLAYTFVSQTNVIPADGTECWCYGVSGDLTFEATIKATIIGGVLVFDYALPDTYSGLFYFSVNFVQTEITLTNTVTIDTRYYFAAGIYAEFSPYYVVVPNPPLLTGGNIDVFSKNDPSVCDFGDGGPPGSQIIVSADYTGGNVTAGTKFNVLVIFYPSARAFLFQSDPFAITPTTIATIDVCLRFAGSLIFYFAVSITDANGEHSNSLANYFIPSPDLNDTGADEAAIKKAS